MVPTEWADFDLAERAARFRADLACAGPEDGVGVPQGQLLVAYFDHLIERGEIWSWVDVYRRDHMAAVAARCPESTWSRCVTEHGGDIRAAYRAWAGQAAA